MLVTEMIVRFYYLLTVHAFHANAAGCAFWVWQE